jgi:tetratricopeptide (TPR) repeat protein
MTEFLRLPGRDEPQVNILKLFGNWLRCSTSQWLLVLDNADVEDVLFKPTETGNSATPGLTMKKPIDYLLVPTHGQTILTTRYQKVATLCLDACDVINIGPMSEVDAVSLFRNRTEQGHALEDIEELAHALGYIPLAIAQAAAYTKSFVPPCSIAAYLAKLNETNKSDASLLKANFNELRRDLEASNSIITTWQISFEHIRKIRPSAADRLSLMSFFDHRGIPKTLLRMEDYIKDVSSSETSSEASSETSSLSERSGFALPSSEVQDIAEDTSMDNELERDISMLHDFHLLAVNVDTNDLEMHPMVQLSARKWLESYKKDDDWLHKSIKTLDSTLAMIQRNKMAEFVLQWKKFNPHVQLASEIKPQSHKTWSRQMRILSIAGLFMRSQYRYAESETLARRLWVEHKHEYGDHHIATLEREIELGDALCDLNRYEDAFAILDHVLRVTERRFKSRRSNKELLIECLILIGELEGRSEHLAEAEAYLRRALVYMGDSPYGKHHLNCTEILVKVLRKQQKNQEAEDWCYRCFEFCKENYEADHRYRLKSSRLLAELLSKEKRFDEASEVLQQGLEAADHKTEMSLVEIRAATNILASILMLQKKVPEASRLSQREMEIYDEILGETHPATLRATEAYAKALNELGEHCRAIEVMRSCAMISRRVLGPDHKNALRRTQSVTVWEQKLKNAETRATQTMHDAQQRREALPDRTSRGKREDYCAVQ